MYWNPQNANAGNLIGNRMPRSSAPAFSPQRDIGMMNMVRNSFSPTTGRFSMNPQNQKIDPLQTPPLIQRFSFGVQNNEGSKIQADHVHLKSMMRPSKSNAPEEKPRNTGRPTATFMSEEVQNIVEKIQKAKDQVDKTVKKKNSFEGKPNQSLETPNQDPIVMNKFEAIIEDNNEHNNSSNELANDSSGKDTSKDINQIKGPNVFTSNKSQEKLTDLDFEKEAMDNSMNAMDNGKDNQRNELVNIYSERVRSDSEHSGGKEGISFPNQVKKGKI